MIKSPGTDGLPAEFYKMFWPKLKELYHEVILEAITVGELHLTAQRGIISLLEKLNRNILKLANWRPLSLLNVDGKIYSKTLARRLQAVQQQTIHETQTGFVKGRHLSENIIKIMEIIQNCEDKNIPGVIISFDFLKAFDRVEWECIFTVMEEFNFGEKYIRMAKVLFEKPLACAYNNGYWSEFFQLSRGTRQGCCFYPIIFTLVVEILGLAVRQNKEIKGIKLGESEIKAGQYADDLWSSLLATEQNINQMIKELNLFGAFSGLYINPEKCAVLRIGSLRNTDAK